MSQAYAEGGWRAIDGLYGKSTWEQSKCVNTHKASSDPWLSIDLGKTVDMTAIVLHNRKDCCGYHNDGVTVVRRGAALSTPTPHLDL